ncbi:centromere protein O isoform X2 [Hemiscyllium ocellatum]|uniref:centromere protein O isoform X2 n=1 Tax=Hemiscyllium ocellatum TaxID=170820 RepID=UPI00296639AC|nr:centromere protein O isoform X2 [Hemiscyllium ocellatum]
MAAMLAWQACATRAPSVHPGAERRSPLTTTYCSRRLGAGPSASAIRESAGSARGRGTVSFKSARERSARRRVGSCRLPNTAMAATAGAGVLEHLKTLEKCAKKLASEQLEAQHRAQVLEQEKTLLERLRSKRDALRTRVTAQSAGSLLDILTETRTVSVPLLDKVDVSSMLLKGRVKTLQDILDAYSLAGVSVKVREPSSTFSFCISTAYEGIYLDSYYLDIHTKHPRKIIQHNIPAFIPLEQTARMYLQNDLGQFVDVLRDALNAYASRRYQVEQLQVHHHTSLTGQVQKNAAYNLLKFQCPIQCGDMHHDVQVKLVYEDLACYLPTEVTLTCTEDSESMRTKLESYQQLFQNMELHRVFNSLKMQQEAVVSSSCLSAVHRSASPSRQ